MAAKTFELLLSLRLLTASDMENQWFLRCLQFIVITVAFKSATCLKLKVPTNPIYNDQTVDFTWVSNSSDPALFNVNVICNNVAVPLQNSVRGSEGHLSVSVRLSPTAAKYSSNQCVLRATDTSNNSIITSSPSFTVLSVGASSPLGSSRPQSATTRTASITKSTFSSASTSATSLSTTDTTSLSSSEPQNSGTFLSSSTSGLAQASAQLTTGPGFSVSGQATAITETFTTTDSHGNVWTITSEASVTLAGVLTTAPSGFTAVERTTTITFITGSSTSVATLTFTTAIPIQSIDSPVTSNAPRLNLAQIASIVGGTLGGVIVLSLVFFLVCSIRRRRARPPTSTFEPFIYDSAYRQPVEKSGAHHTLSSFSRMTKPSAQSAEDTTGTIQTEHAITSSTQLSLDVQSYVRPRDLEALTQDAMSAKQLRLQVQRMSERILELEDQRREFETFDAQWSYSPAEDTNPPDYADTTDSYSYAQRITHD